MGASEKADKRGGPVLVAEHLLLSEAARPGSLISRLGDPALRALSAAREAGAACRCMACSCPTCRGSAVPVPSCPQCFGARSIGIDEDGNLCPACSGLLLAPCEAGKCSTENERVCDLWRDITRCPKRRAEQGLVTLPRPLEEQRQALLASARERGLPPIPASVHIFGRLTERKVVRRVRRWIADQEPVLTLCGHAERGKLTAAVLFVLDRGIHALAGLAEHRDFEPAFIGRAQADQRLVLSGLHERLSALAWRRLEGLCMSVLEKWGRIILVGNCEAELLMKVLPFVSEYPIVEVAESSHAAGQ